MKNIVIGILAHVDSGKTTLSEAMLYKSGQIKNLGRVDHGDSFLDNNELEINRGITIFSKQAVMPIGDKCFYILDTPGHVDFSAEMERTLSVIDYGILVVSGSEGVQSHTETLWKMFNDYNIPCFIFINKMDLVWKEQFEIIAELQEKLSKDIIDFSSKRDEGIYLESIAESDELTLNSYLDTGKISDKEIVRLIKERKIFPCYFGSGLKVDGIEEFLNGLSYWTSSKTAESEFGAKIYKIAKDSQGNRLTYMKVTSGSINVKDSITFIEDGITYKEKINQIRVYSGNKFKTVDYAMAGMVVALVGLSHSKVGYGLGIEKNLEKTMLEPVLNYRVTLPEGLSPILAYEKIKTLEEEDPKLYIKWISEKEEIQLNLMGEIQLDIVKALIEERFGYLVAFDQGDIVYKETILNKVEGVGHFEPLRHYAEVHLYIEPSELGSGITIDNQAKEDDFDKNWQRLVLTHIAEKEHRGVLVGGVLTDAKITLAGGRAHKKHTDGGDFRQATYRAIRQGLMMAESQLLEPWYDFTIEVPVENVGRAISDVDRMKGSCQPPEIGETMAKIKGRAPVATMNTYQSELNNYAKGRGKLVCAMGGYYPCHNEEEVVLNKAYSPESDLDNSPNSVFCKGGAGYTVMWDEVYDAMDVESYLAPPKVDYEEKARKYVATLATDKELMAIYERTYGTIKDKKSNQPRVVKAKPKEDWSSYASVKTQDYSGKEYILVDGYNVIYAWDNLNELLPMDYGAARDKLIDILANYAGFMECEMIVVFDAYKVKGNIGSVETIKGISVVYTKEAETADMYIEKVTHKIGKKHKVRVVTSDGLEQMIILGHGALRVSSRGFLEEVTKVEETIRSYL